MAIYRARRSRRPEYAIPDSTDRGRRRHQKARSPKKPISANNQIPQGNPSRNIRAQKIVKPG
jgi:hypothetical protein